MILNKENMRNKKVILILCLLVLVSGSVQAQRLKAVQNEKGRYGFMTEDGTVVIKYKYDEATPFKDGIAKIGCSMWRLVSCGSAVSLLCPCIWWCAVRGDSLRRCCCWW